MGFYSDQGIPAISTARTNNDRLAAVARRRDAFNAACPFERASTVYIDLDVDDGSSTGGGGAGTLADPFLVSDGDDLLTLIQAQQAADKSILIKRGNVYRCVSSNPTTPTVRCLVTSPNVTIGSYGTGARPLVILCRYQASGGNAWTFVSGNRWQNFVGSSYFANCAALRVAHTDSRRYWEHFRQQTTGTDVQTYAGIERRWFLHVDNHAVSVNDSVQNGFGSPQFTDTGDPDGFNWYFYYVNEHTAIDVQSSGCRIEGIDFEGWGMSNNVTVNQPSAIRMSQRDGAPGVVKDVTVSARRPAHCGFERRVRQVRL